MGERYGRNNTDAKVVLYGPLIIVSGPAVCPSAQVAIRNRISPICNGPGRRRQPRRATVSIFLTRTGRRNARLTRRDSKRTQRQRRLSFRVNFARKKQDG